MIEAVLFDVDGTLVDHRAAASHAVTVTVRDAAPAVDTTGLVDRWFAPSRSGP